ncbi:hypothetical protein AA313_de0208593 [Arthrobotrys entomopaga]|nr:hypothetical protein AA313_de0208593 [Arthrobotrys entomopaga]
MLGGIIEHDPHTKWVNSFLKNATSLDTFMYSAVQYSASPAVVLKLDYMSIAKRLEINGVGILPGPCTDTESSILSNEVLRLSYQQLWSATAASAKQNPKAGDRKFHNTDSASLAKGLHDLMMACQAHQKGCSFLTQDLNFLKNFAEGLDKMGITVYGVPESWTKTGTSIFALSPPQ